MQALSFKSKTTWRRRSSGGDQREVSFFRRLHALVCSGKLTLPPKDLRSVILVSMLFSDHPQEIISVNPSRRMMRVMSLVGRLLRYELPA
jgi:hypothetical protein